MTSIANGKTTMAWWNGSQTRAQGPDFQRSHLPRSIRKRLADSGREVSPTMPGELDRAPGEPSGAADRRTDEPARR